MKIHRLLFQILQKSTSKGKHINVYFVNVRTPVPRFPSSHLTIFWLHSLMKTHGSLYQISRKAPQKASTLTYTLSMWELWSPGSLPPIWQDLPGIPVLYRSEGHNHILHTKSEQAKWDAIILKHWRYFGVKKSVRDSLQLWCSIMFPLNSESIWECICPGPYVCLSLREIAPRMKTSEIVPIYLDVTRFAARIDHSVICFHWIWGPDLLIEYWEEVYFKFQKLKCPSIGQ